MKNIIFIAYFLFPVLAQAQAPNDGKLESRKVAFISTRLDLSPAEAKLFWPIYNDFTREQNALRKERAQKMISFRKIKEIDELSDTEIQTLILNDFSFKQRELNLEKKYYNRFKSNLPIKIVGKFYRAQEAFKKEILNQLRLNNQQRNSD